MGRYSVGEIVPVISMYVKCGMGSIIWSPRFSSTDDLLDIDARVIECTECHDVPYEFDETKVFDGYVFIDDQNNRYENQYPVYAAGFSNLADFIILYVKYNDDRSEVVDMKDMVDARKIVSNILYELYKLYRKINNDDISLTEKRHIRSFIDKLRFLYRVIRGRFKALGYTFKISQRKLKMGGLYHIKFNKI